MLPPGVVVPVVLPVVLLPRVAEPLVMFPKPLAASEVLVVLVALAKLAWSAAGRALEEMGAPVESK